MASPEPDRARFERHYDVPATVMERLDIYADLLRHWQRAKNLVSNTTLDQFWSRHVFDSYQLLELGYPGAHWLDLGSGAGLPGLVVALGRDLSTENSKGGSVTLIEANGRKCAFLRAVSRETNVPVTIVNNRIESVSIPDLPHVPDIITARALAPLDKLVTLMAPLMRSESVALVHKGQDFASEIEKASKYCDFDVIQHKSQLDDRSVILALSKLRLHP